MTTQTPASAASTDEAVSATPISVSGSAAATSVGVDVASVESTITAIDARSVSFELSDVGPVFVDDDPNGRYVAPRCAAR